MMQITDPKLNPCLSFYQGNESLQVQFIFTELMNSHRELSFLANFIRSEDFLENQCAKTLITHFQKLIGDSPQPYHIFTWNFKNGFLNKLKCHCHHLAENFHEGNSVCSSIQENVDRAWIHIVECVDRLQTLGISSIQPIITHIEKALNRLKKLAKNLKKILLYFRNDEKVLYFLLSHQVELSIIYSENFVANFFKKIFPHGHIEAENYLKEAYREQGFDEILLMISQKVATLTQGNKSEK